jgi:N-glycosylase/DNA lyase
MESKQLTALEEFYSDIIITAVEGGIGYWSKCSNYRHGHDADLNRISAASVTVHELTDERRDTYAAGVEVTIKDIAKAMRRIVKQRPEHTSDEWRARMAKALREKDCCDIDSGDADCIMQIAVLGMITYG